MQSGYYNTTGGMVTQFNRLDLISNNLANLNTTGFKRDDVVIGDYLRLYETHKEQLPIEDHTRKAAKFLNRTLDRVPIISEEYTDRSVGNLTQTDNPLDFALQRENAFLLSKHLMESAIPVMGALISIAMGRLSIKMGIWCLVAMG